MTLFCTRDYHVKPFQTKGYHIVTFHTEGHHLMPFHLTSFCTKYCFIFDACRWIKGDFTLGGISTLR